MDKLAPLRLGQTQLNFAVFCTSSTWGVSSEHLNYKKHPMAGLLYRFHIRRVLESLQVLLPHEAGLNTADNLYTNEEFFKICERIMEFFMII